MKYKNSVHPSKEQMEGFLEGDNEAPIAMINLLKFKEKAEYEDGRDTDLTGEQAYAIYGKEVVEHLKKVGGKSIFWRVYKSPNAWRSGRALGYNIYC